jgi:Protein of unknown function (DUF3800)
MQDRHRSCFISTSTRFRYVATPSGRRASPGRTAHEVEMKFCYVDESGKGEEPILVLTGIVTDAYRMHVTKADWLRILERLSQDVNRPIEEFHTRHFYRGNSTWRGLNGDQRTAVLEHIFQWLTERNHKIVFSAVDKQKLDSARLDGKGEFTRGGKPDYWKLGALHLLLSIQKVHQGEEGTKGHTVIIFDQGSSGEEAADIVLNPPLWSDSFCGYQRSIRKRKVEVVNPEPPLSVVIDVPYFADSRHVGMLQVADLFAYLLRHYAELRGGHAEEEYDGELNKISGWVSHIAALLVPDNFRWKATGGCECSNFFREVAPEALLQLHKTPPRPGVAQKIDNPQPAS